MSDKEQVHSGNRGIGKVGAILGIVLVTLVTFATLSVSKARASLDMADKSVEAGQNDPGTFISLVEISLDTSETITATATLIPFPTVTFIFPERTPTANLLSAERQPDMPALSKPKPESTRIRIARLWPFAVLLLAWVILALWFILAERFLDR